MQIQITREFFDTRHKYSWSEAMERYLTRPVTDETARFENVVEVHLLKWVHFEQDAAGRDLELRYFPDVNRREVDFIITEGLKPLMAIECKWNDAPIGKGRRYFKTRFPRCEAFQLSAIGTMDFKTPEGIRACPAIRHLRQLV